MSSPAPVIPQAQPGPQQTPVDAWWQYAQSLHPDTPDAAYDALRTQFYNQRAGPQLSQQGYGFESGRQQFMQQTERPDKSAMPRTSLTLRSAAAAAAAPIVGEEAAEREFKVPQAEEEAVRQGVSPGPYKFAGSMVGQAPYWAAGMAAAPATIPARIVAGGIIQGAYDAAKSPVGTRAIEGIKGAVSGAAMVGAFEGLGPLAKTLLGKYPDTLTPEAAQATQQVAKGLATPAQEEMAIDGATQAQSEQTIRQHVAQSTAATKAAGAPATMSDRVPSGAAPPPDTGMPMPGRVKVQFQGADGKSYILGGKGGLSLTDLDKTSDRIQGHLERGGSITNIWGDQTAVERFQNMIEVLQKPKLDLTDDVPREADLPFVREAPGSWPEALFKPKTRPNDVIDSDTMDAAKSLAEIEGMPLEDALKRVGLQQARGVGRRGFLKGLMGAAASGAAKPEDIAQLASEASSSPTAFELVKKLTNLAGLGDAERMEPSGLVRIAGEVWSQAEGNYVPIRMIRTLDSIVDAISSHGADEKYPVALDSLLSTLKVTQDPNIRALLQRELRDRPLYELVNMPRFLEGEIPADLESLIKRITTLQRVPEISMGEALDIGPEGVEARSISQLAEEKRIIANERYERFQQTKVRPTGMELQRTPLLLGEEGEGGVMMRYAVSLRDVPPDERAAAEPPETRTDPGRSRGWTDLPLDSQGIDETDNLAKQFAARGGLDALFSSDLTRAKQTMGLLASRNPLAVIRDITPFLRTQGRGDLEGLPHDVAVRAENALAREAPDVATPGPHGESLNDYSMRFLAYLRNVIVPYSREHPNERIGVISHGSDIATADAHGKAGLPPDYSYDPEDVIGKREPEDSVHRYDIDTGRTRQVNMEPATPYDEVGRPDAGADLDPGVYLIRHGHTPWNATDLPATLADRPSQYRMTEQKPDEGWMGQTWVNQGLKPQVSYNLPQIEAAAQDFPGEAHLRDTMFHENLHASIGSLGMRRKVAQLALGSDNPLTSWRGDFVHDVFKGGFDPESQAVYKQARALIPEEVFAYTTSAIRTANERRISMFADADTDKETVLKWATDVSNDVMGYLETLDDSLHKRTLERRLDSVVARASRSLDEIRNIFDNAPGTLDMEDGHWVYRDYDTVQHFDSREQAIHYMETLYAKPLLAPELVDLDSLPEGVPRLARRIDAPNNRRAPLQGDPPPPELSEAAGERPTPGSLGLSYFFRPFYDWLSTVAQRYDTPLLWAAGDRLDKATGEMDVQMLPYVKTLSDTLLKSSKDRNTAFTKFLEAQPESKQAVADELGITNEEMLMLKKYDDEFVQPMKQRSGSSLTDYLMNIRPKVRDAKYDIESLYPDRGRDHSYGFWGDAIQRGAVDPREDNLLNTSAAYLRLAMQREYLAEPLKDFRKLVDAKDPETGDSLYGALRPLMQRHADYIQGIPDWSQKVVMSTIEHAVGGINGVLEKVNSILPEKLQIPTLDEGPRDILSKWITFSYAGGLGLRPMVPIRDASQIFLTSYPILGNYMWKGMQKAFSAIKEGEASDAWQEARQAGAFIERSRIGEMYAGGAPEHVGIEDRATELAQRILKPIQYAHNSNRLVAFWGHQLKVADALESWGDHADLDTLQRESDMWFMNSSMRQKYTQEILNAPRENWYDISKRMASDLVDLSQWNYNRGANPGIYKYQLGRLFGQYGMWPLNYIEYARRFVTGLTGEQKTEGIKALTRLVAAHGAVLAAAQAVGIDAGHWVFTQPMAYGGGPILTAVQNIPQSMDFETWRGEQARGELKQLVWPEMIPGGAEAHDIWEAVTANDPDVYLRIMGFKPMGKSEEERGYHKFIP